ncbi:MAG TPA: MBL fold metallo-hydrolase [Candidatus Bilamarchaeum sp.]|nr:MBL fold metallo-hydrolase [Candidatus Bilamarchaeum sp.]
MRIPCKGISIGLDSPDGDVSFLSHAHSDHTAGLKSMESIISSQETLDLAGMEARIAGHPEARMIDAGHILGARQLLVDNDGERIAYTGDFCLKPNIFGFKAEIPECDRLIMEATYGNPNYVFPPNEDVHRMVASWVQSNDKKNLIIGCYELGKAQEVIRILNECGVAPVVPKKTEGFCAVYEKYGLRLDRVPVGSEEAEEVMSRRFVAIVPMGKAKRYFAKRLADAFERPTLCAVATGWALHYRFNTDTAFPLSDHADFEDLVHFVEQTGAKQVEFFCGDGSAVLRRLEGRTVING